MKPSNEKSFGYRRSAIGLGMSVVVAALGLWAHQKTSAAPAVHSDAAAAPLPRVGADEVELAPAPRAPAKPADGASHSPQGANSPAEPLTFAGRRITPPEKLPQKAPPDPVFIAKQQKNVLALDRERLESLREEAVEARRNGSPERAKELDVRAARLADRVAMLGQSASGAR
jgi:hypothetical protein